MPNRSAPAPQMSEPTLGEIANRWTQITHQRMKEAMTRYKIRDTGTLMGSLRGQVVKATETTLSVRFSYRKYGQYVDMGVGRGVARGTRKTAAFTKYRNEKGQLIRYKRKPRPWYSKVIAKEVIILGNIAADNIAKRTGSIIFQIPRRLEI